MRDYRFHGFTREGAAALAGALEEDGFSVERVHPGDQELAGWGVRAHGEPVSEALLEELAQFFGGVYEGDDMSFG
ncbi:MAG: hypothetical protein ACRDZ9_07075 [Acidimicrobiales bacterium]